MANYLIEHKDWLKMEKNTSLKVIALGALIFIVGQLFSKTLGYIYRIIIARQGVEEYGIFSFYH